MTDFLNAIRKLIETFAPALAVMIYDYEEDRIQESKDEALDAKVKLDIEKNHQSIDSKYANKSDLDVITGSNEGQSGNSTKTN